ncbi:MAG: protein kinase [Anaerolineae bacterium]|nr:protein kinase [Anaerolineae bacterium]
MQPRWVGKRVDDFVIEDRIGRGGMATVFRAHQISVNRYVALKIIDLTPNYDERDEFRQRFAQEVAVVAVLEHIHILPIYGHGIVENEFAYLAMRLLRGGSLADLLRKGPLPLHRAADIFTQIARGLQYAHNKHVIHRDLKPSNILLDDAGTAYLSDFGLAKMMGSTINLTKSGNLVGTPAYVAPEQVRGDPADVRSDIYSLGILLYHMLVGRPPFELTEMGISALLYKHVEEPPPPPSLLNPTVTSEVEAVILRALEKNPDDRYQSVDDMMHDLTLALGRKPNIRSMIALRTPRRLQQLSRTSRFPLRSVAMVSAVMLVVIMSTLMLLNSRLRTIDIPVQIAAGVQGTLSDVTPTTNEIEAAQARLGAQGFVAHLACSLDTVTSATRAREMGDMASAFGLAYKVYNADNNAQTQVAQLRQARAEGARAFILCPINADMLTDSINMLQANNLPLVYITLFDNAYGVKLDSGSYNVGLVVGRLAGQTFNAERTDEAKVVVLTRLGLVATESRADGMEAGFREMVPNATFIGRYEGATEAESSETIRALIEAGTDFNVILSLNDVGAYGAIQALQAANFSPDSVIIVSANGESYAQELIREGTFLRGTVALNREQASQSAVDAIVKMLAGSEVPEIITYPPGEILTQQILQARGG